MLTVAVAVLLVAGVFLVVRMASGDDPAATAPDQPPGRMLEGRNPVATRTGGSAAAEFLSGEVPIGVSTKFPGWGYGDQPDGFDLALVRYLQKKYHFTPVWVPVDAKDREPYLVSRRVKLIVAAYSIDGASSTQPDRKRTDVLDFAGPYFADQSGIMFDETKRRAVTPGTGIPGDHICVAQGTTAETYLGSANPVRLPTNTDCFDRFGLAGDNSVVGVVTDETILRAYAKGKGGDVSPVMWSGEGHVINQEKYGIGMAEGHDDACRELAADVNAFLGDPGPDGAGAAFDTFLKSSQNRDKHLDVAADLSLCE